MIPESALNSMNEVADQVISIATSKKTRSINSFYRTVNNLEDKEAIDILRRHNLDLPTHSKSQFAIKDDIWISGRKVA